MRRMLLTLSESFFDSFHSLFMFCYTYARFGPDLTTQGEILNKTCIEVFSLSSCIRKIYYWPYNDSSFES